MYVEPDRLFKQLLSNFFDSFVEMFLPEIAGYISQAATYTELKTELFSQGGKRRSAEADLVFKVGFRESKKDFLIHVETQTKFESDFGVRLLKYNVLLMEKYQLPVCSVVLFSFSRPGKLQPDFLHMFLENIDILQFYYKVVQLNTLSWREYTNKLNPAAIALMAKMKLAPEERVEVKLQCMRGLIALRLGRKKEAVVWEFIDAYLALSELEEQSYERVLENLNAMERRRMKEVRMSWKQQGEVVGEARGKEIGKAIGSLDIVCRLLNNAIGPLSASAVASLSELSVEQLQALTDFSPNFQSESDLNDWLASQKRKS